MPLVARSHVTTLLIELWQCEQLKWHGDDWWQRLWSPTQNPFWDFLRSEKGLKHKDCSESWYEIVRMRERTTFSRACLPECRAAAWPRLAAGGTWTCLCKWPAFSRLASPPCLNRYIVILPCRVTSFTMLSPFFWSALCFCGRNPCLLEPVFPLQCCTSVLQSSYNVHVPASLYNVLSFQFPVSCLPARLPFPYLPACRAVVPGHFSLLSQPGFPTLPRLVLITPFLTLMYLLCSPSTTYRSHLRVCCPRPLHRFVPWAFSFPVHCPGSPLAPPHLGAHAAPLFSPTPNPCLLVPVSFNNAVPVFYIALICLPSSTSYVRYPCFPCSLPPIQFMLTPSPWPLLCGQPAIMFQSSYHHSDISSAQWPITIFHPQKKNPRRKWRYMLVYKFIIQCELVSNWDPTPRSVQFLKVW